MFRKAAPLLAIMAMLVGCGTNDDKPNNTSQGSSVIDSTISESHTIDQLLLHEMNIKDNGFIIINDKNDFPDFIENLRYCEKKTDNVYSICTFDGTVIFELETTIYPIFNDGITPYSKDGISYGYVDLDGNVIAEPVYEQAGYFCNGTAKVSESKNEYFINTRGEKSEDQKLKGYSGKTDDFVSYNAFTGEYLMYCKKVDRVYGYANKDGTCYDMPNFSEISSFNSSYAFVTETSGNSYFINSDFEQVTRDLKIDLYYDIDFQNDDWCGATYIFNDGYFTATIMNEATNYVPERKLIKICPELYK